MQVNESSDNPGGSVCAADASANVYGWPAPPLGATIAVYGNASVPVGRFGLSSDGVAIGSTSSAERGVRELPEKPPAISTRPSLKVVAVCPCRVTIRLPAPIKPDPGTKRSIEAIAGRLLLASVVPPTSNTDPSGCAVAVWRNRGLSVLPALVNCPVDGSNSSGVTSRDWALKVGPPPTISTRQSPVAVAVWEERPVAIGPVGIDEPNERSTTSALAPLPNHRCPPATRTDASHPHKGLPAGEGGRGAGGRYRGDDKEPLGLEVRVARA